MKYIMASALFIVLLGNCSPNMMKGMARSMTGHDTQSMVMIGESRDVIYGAIKNFRLEFKDDFEIIDRGDTLGYIANVDAYPISSLFFFENDINVKQELDIYCSPCADKMIAAVLRDTRYDFVSKDAVNYVSLTSPPVIMKLKKPEDTKEACHKITAYLKDLK